MAGFLASWSNSRQSWRERGAFVILLALAGAAWWYAGRLSPALQFAVWVLLLALLLLVLRRGWLKLCGPILFYELVRTARRRGLVRARIIYALLLLTVLVTLWLAQFIDKHDSLLELFDEWQLPPNAVAELNLAVTCIFLALQLFVAFLLTPAYVAAAIVEEKQRRTLEFLLATDLRNREIVLSMLVSRLANIFLVRLTGLPILALLQLLGGSDPALLRAGFEATGLTVLSLGSVAVLCSVYARKPLDAIVRSYLIVLAYLALTASAAELVRLVPAVASWPSDEEWTSPVTLSDVTSWASTGNIVTSIGTLKLGLEKGTPLNDLLPEQRADYAWFHGLTALTCVVWAVLRLRAVALKQASGPPPRRFKVRESAAQRVGDDPMLWKEAFAKVRVRSGWLARLGAAILVGGPLLPGLGIVGMAIWYFVDIGWDELSEAMYNWVRIAGTSVACLMLLAVAVRAAGSISGERERQTLDTLLTTPIDSTDILFAKWLGSILRTRRAWLWLGAIWGLAYSTGGLDWTSAAYLLGAWLVYASFLASLGLWFSAGSKSTARATVGTLLAVVLVMAGHWIVGAFYVPLLERLTRSYTIGDWAMRFHAYALTPPMTLDLLTFSDQTPRELDRWELGIVFALFGLAVYGLGAVWLWLLALTRFRRSIGRAVAPVERSVAPRHAPRVLPQETVA